MDEDFVETSDIEELAELMAKDRRSSSSPGGRKYSVQNEVPWKRIKLIHEGSYHSIPSSPLPPCHSSPLKDSHIVNRSIPDSNYEKPRSSSEDSHKSNLWEKQTTPATPASSRTRSSTTAPVVGSPTTSELYFPPSPTGSLPRATIMSQSLAPGSPSPSLSAEPPSVIELVHPSSPAPIVETDEVLAAELQGQRYSLRKRHAAQLAPYTADLLLYKRALRHNPDAIVKMRQIERQIVHERQQQRGYLDDRYEDGGVDPLEALDEAEWEEREWRRRRRLEKMKDTAPVQDLQHYPDILQDLTTDEEEKEMDAASKAARRILRLKEREQKKREKEAKRREEEEARYRMRVKRLKQHPLSKSMREGSPRASPEIHDTDGQPRPSSSRGLSPPFPSFHSVPGRSASVQVEQEEVINNYFKDIDSEMLDAFDGFGTNDAQSYPSPLPDPVDDLVEIGYSDPPSENDLVSKRRRILGKMMPKGMADELALQASKSDGRRNRRSHSPVSSVVGSDDLLLPGQSRIRRISGDVKDAQEIKGDSESEGEPPSDRGYSSSSPSVVSAESDSDSEAIEILHTYRPPPPLPPIHKFVEPETIYIESDSEGDEDIQFFVQQTRPVKKTKLRDQSLIDYMLPRGPRVKSSRSKYKYDITTRGGRGYGRERQTLLSFDEHGLQKKRRAMRAIENSSNHLQITPASRGNDDALFEGQAAKQPSKKGKDALRKAKAKKNGVYNFNSGGNGRITSGRRTDAAFFTVDLEDEGFHHALAPTTWSGSGPRYEPPPPRKRKNPHVRTMSSTNTLSKGLPEPQHEEIPLVQDDLMKPSGGNMKHLTCDLGIKRMSSGRSFNQSSYIRKGWLHELVNNVASGTPVGMAPPPSTILCRFEFTSAMSVTLLCATLPKLFDALFEAATDILDADSDIHSDEWKPGLRITSQLVSWHLQNAEEGEKTIIREVVDREICRISNQMDKHSINFIEKPILSLCWFLVELSARVVSGPLPTAYVNLSSSSLKASSKMLMQLLLRLGIQKTSEAIQSNTDLDEAILDHYATELWVCLIHLLGLPKEGNPHSKSNPFWTIFMDALPTVVVVAKDSTRNSIKVSEDVWLCAFSLSALSQFSIHGMATAEPRLPAYWDLVAYALKAICLTENNEEQQQHFQQVFLRKRDRYVALVVTRCEHLHKVWHWRLDEGSSMFNQISEIFRSRNFSNLRFEEDKLPKFFKRTDWKLLESHDSTDTIFSIFLKLIMSADRDQATNVGGGGRNPAAKLKKLLSLAVPLRSLSFPSHRPPTGRELSMFYNRLSAIALALYLDPSDHDDRIEKARTYVNFSTVVDHKTRHTVLCGVERLCHLMIRRDMNLGARMMDWFEDICKVADAGLKVYTYSEHHSPCRAKNFRDPPVQLVKHLFETVCRIVASYADAGRFFEPLLFGKLKPILASQILRTDTLREELAQLLDVIFTARLRVLPKPARPFTPQEEASIVNGEEEESQNYFEDFDDIDFSAIDLLLPGNDAAATDILEKDRLFRQDVDGKLKWVIYAHLKPYVASSPPSTIPWKTYANECDKWLRRWLCFHDLEQNQETKWQNTISLLDALMTGTRDKDNDDPWMHRVNLSIMFQLLQLDPMAYLTFKNRALQVFFRALVSDSITLENEYVSCLLSIDCLRHPILAGAGAVLPPKKESADYYYLFSADQFLELRLPLIRVIFRNIERGLMSNEDAGEMDMEERTGWIDFCHDMFSWMRRVRTRLLHNHSGETVTTATTVTTTTTTTTTAAATQQYTQFCLQVLEAFQDNALLRSQSRLEFYVGWARTFGPVAS